MGRYRIRIPIARLKTNYKYRTLVKKKKYCPFCENPIEIYRKKGKYHWNFDDNCDEYQAYDYTYFCPQCDRKFTAFQMLLITRAQKHYNTVLLNDIDFKKSEYEIRRKDISYLKTKIWLAFIPIAGPLIFDIMYAKREKSFPIHFGGYAYFYYVFLVALLIVAYNYHEAIYQYNNFLGIAYIPFAVIFITLFTFLRSFLELKAAERTIKEEIEKQFYEANK